MMRGLTSKGFTIVETMIFLAVSGGILISAIALIGGSQNKAQFNVAVQDFEEQVTKVLNNVANGYYPGLGANKKCQVNASYSAPPSSPSNYPLQIVSGTTGLGQSQECVFLGRVIEFNDGDEFFEVYSIAGVREVAPGKANTKMSTSKATALTPAERISIKNGLKVKTIKSGSDSYGSVGFFSSLGDLIGSTDQLVSGGLSSDYIGMSENGLTNLNGVPGFVSSTLLSDYDAKKNPLSGIVICVESGSTAQHAVLTLGGEGATSAVNKVVNSGVCPP